MTKKAIAYIEQALEIAKKERDQIVRVLEEHAHVAIENKQSIDAWFKRHESGYDIGEEISKQVEIEIAIGDIERLLYFERRRTL